MDRNYYRAYVEMAKRDFDILRETLSRRIAPDPVIETALDKLEANIIVLLKNVNNITT